MTQRRSATGGPLRWLALTLALAGGAIGLGATEVRAQGLVAGGDAPDLFMLFTGDVIGYIDPCG